MRDIHYDGEFLRDFLKASEKWSWATWNQARVAQDETAMRLLRQVFDGQLDGPFAPADTPDETGE